MGSWDVPKVDACLDHELGEAYVECDEISRSNATEPL
jgi:hypothetical protein